ncbi:hypothetical protein [Algoriphagus marincola]|uniref:hypothetical protein n=1 Tax=Algoriphagus marincola TaxID=264027 RepID=UPI000410F4B0|nr:hypothetical protein [Algoriphagus marincola]
MASVWMVECNVVDRGGAPGSSGIPVGPPPGGGTPTNPLPPTGNPGEDDESNNFCRDNHCIPFPEEEIIKDSSFVGTKADRVYEKLLDLSGGFRKAIQKFDGEFPVAHLKFNVDPLMPDTINATTNNAQKYIIEISINGNTLEQRTTLGLARTMAHEIIHAELFRKVRSVNNQISINDFPEIYDYYIRYLKNWQHEQMAAPYRNLIADIIQEFDNGKNSRQFYMDLAWEGLINTSSWENLSIPEKQRVVNTIIGYKNSGDKSCKL